ncbi:unnamed protein product [Ilex paraguariensis]|uniref:Uncharacterized protein n=1 Tax=Ilex paraguariensis TaxID=185542 RepID=A0ABC8UWF4_9AQUA
MAQRADPISLSTNEELANHISLSINDELARFSPTPYDRCIFRVHDKLRAENEKAYEPSIIAIGPYYHGIDKLQKMEEHKLLYLQQLLQRRNETGVDKYVMALIDMEERARKCYTESSILKKADFVKMMLFDGIFVVELFRKSNAQSSSKYDLLFQFWSIRAQVTCDLLLLENQLPFFILVMLFNMTREVNTDEDITFLALSFLGRVVPGPTISKVSDISIDHVQHLLHLVHGSMCFSFAEKIKSYHDRYEYDNFINTVTELQEFGMEFKVTKESTSLFDIKFVNGLMEIPWLEINDNTESILRNLIAYEQFCPTGQPKYVSDYAYFMDLLVNSPKDVTLLRCSRIIENCSGDDTTVCNMLNKLNNNVILSYKFCYSEVFSNVNKHFVTPRVVFKNCMYELQ